MKLIRHGTGEKGLIPNTNLVETMTCLNHKCGVQRKWQISDLVRRKTDSLISSGEIDLQNLRNDNTK